MSKCTLWGKEVLVDIPPEVFPSQEERKARFDLFPNCEHGWFTSPCNGAQLHYLICRPPNNQTPKGIVVFAHGVQGQSARGFVLQNGRKVAISYLAEQLIQAGYALFALDALGHGFSEGKRFYIERWQDNRKDLDEFAHMVAKQHESVPLFLMGESYGGCLTLHVAALWEDKEKAPKNYEGIVLMAPAVIGDLPPAPLVYTLRYCLAPMFPTWVPFFMPNTVSADRIWSDDEVRAKFTDPRFFDMSLEGCGRAFRLGTAVNLLDAVEDVRQSAIPKLTAPFCVCHGTADAAVLIAGTHHLLEHAQTPEPDRAVLLQEGAFHDLFSEPSADEAVQFVIRFLDKRSEKP